MRITVVGAGRMGKILAAAMAVGNEVALYDADRDSAARLAGSLKLKALATMTETAAANRVFNGDAVFILLLPL